MLGSDAGLTLRCAEGCPVLGGTLGFRSAEGWTLGPDNDMKEVGGTLGSQEDSAEGWTIGPDDGIKMGGMPGSQEGKNKIKTGNSIFRFV